MSKPKPSLAKGVVRTLHPHFTASSGLSAIQLAPVVSQQNGHGYSTVSRSREGSTSHTRSLSTALAALNIQQSPYLSLLPTWDTSPNPDNIVAQHLSRPLIRQPLPVNLQKARYTTATPIIQDQAAFSFSPSFSYIPTASSYSGRDNINPWDVFGYTADTSPPSSPPTLAEHPPTPRPTRPTDSHLALAPNPLTPSDTSSTSTETPLQHYHLSLPTHSINLSTSNTTAEPPSSTPLYTSSLIFHLGSSGLPKERPPLPPHRRTNRSPTPPPRPRTFPIQNISPPPEDIIRSISIGEDAYFTRLDSMCVADGVGGWASSGRGSADAGRWSRLLCHFIEGEVGGWWDGREDYLEDGQKGEGKDGGRGREGEKGGGWARKVWRDGEVREREGKRRRNLDPIEIMQRGYEKCLSCVLGEGINGSSTCLLALLHNQTLHIANLGDCALLIIRHGQVIFRTTEMQHAFNFPLQLGTHSRDEPMKDAQRFDVSVERGDLVIVGSDGLMDNLFDEDILDTLSQFSAPHLTLARTSSSSNSKITAGSPGLTPFSPQKASDALCRKAREISEQSSATTPFMERAIEEGIDFVGGKKDDISVVVGIIGDRDVGGLGLHTR